MMPWRSKRRISPKAPSPILNWHADDLPRREIRPVGRTGSLPFGTTAPPHVPTGPADKPFDFCLAIQRLCTAIHSRCETMQHIDLSRILFAVSQARNGRSHGLQARVTPMRFRDGSLTQRHHGTEYLVHAFAWTVTKCSTS